MNTSDEAYKLAASFYLSSCHDDWTGERLRKAILADINGEDKQALADQQELEVWGPIELTREAVRAAFHLLWGACNCGRKTLQELHNWAFEPAKLEHEHG